MYIRGDETTAPNVPALTPEEQARLDAVKAATAPLAEQNAKLADEIEQMKKAAVTIQLDNERLGLKAKELESGSETLMYAGAALAALFILSKNR